MPRIALATYALLPRLEASERHLADALAQRGADVATPDWRDPGVDWSAFDLVVPRCTWDYTEHLSEFLTWAQGAEQVTDLRNSAAVMAWNADKRYLADLAAAGVPVIPGAFFAPGDPYDGSFAGRECVVKPTVSSGARGIVRVESGRSEEIAAAVEGLHAGGRAALVQPYVASVVQHGEVDMVLINGRLSHAGRRPALLRSSREGGAQVHRDASGALLPPPVEPTTPSAAEIGIAEAVMGELERRFAAGPLLYGRVDTLLTEAGPAVVEVELIEPTLLLSTAPEAAGGIADALLAVV